MFDEFLERLKTWTSIKNQSILARELGISDAAVSSAKRKNQIPDKWLTKLTYKLDVSAHWLLTGEGEPPKREEKSFAQTHIAQSTAVLNQGPDSTDSIKNTVIQALVFLMDLRKNSSRDYFEPSQERLLMARNHLVHGAEIVDNDSIAALVWRQERSLRELDMPESQICSHLRSILGARGEQARKREADEG
ncbi:MAG: helix-turn-helix domain-containing protein [Desulfovibrio sp.]